MSNSLRKSANACIWYSRSPEHAPSDRRDRSCAYHQNTELLNTWVVAGDVGINEKVRVRPQSTAVAMSLAIRRVWLLSSPLSWGRPGSTHSGAPASMRACSDRMLSSAPSLMRSRAPISGAMSLRHRGPHRAVDCDDAQRCCRWAGQTIDRRVGLLP